MSTTFKQTCPLCASPAVFYFVDYENRKYFQCPACTYFLITVTAESRLKGAPAHWLETMKERAQRAPIDEVLVISVGPTSPPGAPLEETLSVTYVQKSQLRL